MCLAPQNIPRATVLTLGNKVVLYCIALKSTSVVVVFANMSSRMSFLTYVRSLSHIAIVARTVDKFVAV